MAEESKNDLKKDHECVRCQFVIECLGKPINVDRCLRLVERGKNDG